MKKIRSIYFIFVFFFIMIIVSFSILYGYSRISLQDSLKSVAQGQMKYARMLLEQKAKEIEIEADGILNSESLKRLQNTIKSDYDVWQYVTDAGDAKEYLKQRQNGNVGMAEFILYWQRQDRVISTSIVSGVDDGLLAQADDSKWFCYKGDLYYVKRYVISKADKTNSAKPYLFIKVERNYLYKIKSLASGMEYGGTMLLTSDDKSLFSTTEVEKELLEKISEHPDPDHVFSRSTKQGKYLLIESGIMDNSLQMVSYYAFSEMMGPVRNINRIMTAALLVFLFTGMLYMVSYYRSILLQLKILTEKLKQVETGDFSTRIEVVSPQNEFSYVFEQFNHMAARIGQLITTTLKEHKLRNQAELRQLQLQIHPHFLYNSLSYIVTVADQPDAVTEMAVHLSEYYRYCTMNKSLTTIGEEVSYARAYLSIMAMRKNIDYSISVSEELYREPMIPLILQPIIENAIEHAIEERENARHIYVKIYRTNMGAVCFEVSDDGNGLSESQIRELKERIAKKERGENESVGLWNVNQRLINYYDESAQLGFGKSIWSGLTVSFTIYPKETEYESIDRG